MADLFEVLMVIFFGISWPINVRKAWRARTAKGTSLLFYMFIWVGYVCGLTSKWMKFRLGNWIPVYFWIVYSLNLIMVTIGIFVYFRNKLLDRKAENAGSRPRRRDASAELEEGPEAAIEASEE